MSKTVNTFATPSSLLLCGIIQTHLTMYQNPYGTFLRAVFAGVILSICLYGIVIVQMLMYFNVFKRDPTWRKCLVAFLFALDTASSVVNVAYMYQLVILQFSVKWLFICDLILTLIITTTVQLFFAWRIKVLTSNKWVTSVIATCTLAGMSAGIATTIATTHVGGFLEFLSFADYQKFKAAAVPTVVFLMAADVLITVTLVWHLKSNKTGFLATGDVIDRIIRVTVPTGMVTAVFAGAYIISLLARPSSGLSLLFYFPLSKLYTNSIMSGLNSRGRWSPVVVKNDQRSSSQLGSTQQMLEKVQVQAEGNDRQDPASPMSNKRAEVFVKVESCQVVEISADNSST